jgi:hypothetical protein
MADTSADDLTVDHGVLVTGKWSWTSASSTGQWSTPQQGIKPRRYHIPSSATDPRNSGYGVLKSRLKIRGKGESLTLRFESQTGKDFQLLGWVIPYEVEVDE